MRIIVCIKQVPATNRVDIDEQTGVLKRAGVDSKVNPYDLYALETALQLKAEYGGSVAVLTMGPPQAESAIREAYMMGADEGAILSDRAFAGSDVLATSYALSQGIRLLGGCDLVVCGKQTTDGDTSQVGPALAEFLQIPHVSWVTKLCGADERGITLEHVLQETVLKVRMDFPCLITVEKGLFQPRLPSYRLKMETAGRQVRRIALKDLPDKAPHNYGLEGSPTQVEQIFPPPDNRVSEKWTGSPDELAARLFDNLKTLKFL